MPVNNRIVLLHQHYRRPGEPGILRPHRTATALAELGYESHVITAEIAKKPGAPLWATTQENGLFIHRANVHYDQKMGETRRIVSYLFFSLASLVKIMSLRPAIIYASSSPLLVSVPAFMGKLLWRSKIVFEVRDLWPGVPIAMGYLRNPVFRRLALALERFSYATADILVALSPGMATSMLTTVHNQKPLHVVPNISDLSLFSPPERDENFPFPEIRENPTLLVYAGSFGETNDVSYLPRLCRELLTVDKNICVVAVGAGSHFDETLALAEQLGVSGVNYFQKAAVSQAELRKLVAQASAYISVFSPNPALEDNSANKFFDGLAAGLPVIINYGGWQEPLLQEFNCGIRLSNPITHQDLMRLTDLMGDEAKLSMMGHNAANLAQSHFSMEIFQKHLAGVILEVQHSAAGSAGGPGFRGCHSPSCELLRGSLALSD